MEPLHIPNQVLKEITNDFSDDQKLGQGGYGSVYKGVYNGEEIAVKTLHSHLIQSDELFLKELGNIAKLRHENIVRLVGFCYESKGEGLMEIKGRMIVTERNYRALCFEYMCNKSLQKYLSDKCDKLDWHKSYRIIKGTCEGLKYLHERPQPILHLDLKPDNILLDKNMVAKLADFGLSKIIEGQLSVMTLNSTGTPRYMPPEFRWEKKRNKEYDIFSLGVVIIEIVMGPSGYNNIAANIERKSAEQLPAQQFIQMEVEKWRSKLQKQWSDSMLEQYCQQVKVCMEIGLECINKEKNERPGIRSIIDRLVEKETEADKLQNKSSMDTAINFAQRPPQTRGHVTKQSPTMRFCELTVKDGIFFLRILDAGEGGHNYLTKESMEELKQTLEEIRSRARLSSKGLVTIFSGGPFCGGVDYEQTSQPEVDELAYCTAEAVRQLFDMPFPTVAAVTSDARTSLPLALVLAHDDASLLRTVSFEVPEVREGRDNLPPYVTALLRDKAPYPLMRSKLLLQSETMDCSTMKYWYALGCDASQASEKDVVATAKDIIVSSIGNVRDGAGYITTRKSFFPESWKAVTEFLRAEDN